ncbi:MAG: cell division protein ZapB [Thermodesulfobacteriota bacterium]
MGNEQLFSQFEEIEKKVEKLFDKIQSLESINAQLKETISDLEKGARKKAEEEEKYSEEKALIRSKVDGLIQKINAFVSQV